MSEGVDHIFREAGILIVEDDPNLLMVLRETCTRSGFKHVFTATDGIEALKVLQRHSADIDLLSLDMVMPNMSGLKVAEIVANTHDRIVGLVMLTGYSNEEFRKEFFSLGSEVGLTEKFLEKPLSSTTILAEYADVIRDVFNKRERQLDIGVSSSLKQVRGALVANATELSNIDERLRTVSLKLESLENRIKDMADREQPKSSSDLSYVWALTVVFMIITSGLAWASDFFHIPLLSVVALASVTILVLMLIAVFDLSKGGRLSERSLMEVLRKAFSFIGKRRK